MSEARTALKDVSSLQLMPEDEKLVIGIGGLYSPFPIPAFKILVTAKEHVAKDVLLCMVSHMGKENRRVFPSYDTIVRETGRSRGSIATAIRTLVEFGFIKKCQIRMENQRKRNVYYLQDACWHHKKMNSIALAYSPVVGRCTCGAAVKEGEMGDGALAFIHFSCGGTVKLLQNFKSRKKKLVDVSS